MGTPQATSTGLLGDTAERDYSRKLRLFNTFAAPELRQAIGTLGLKAGMRVLDAGCGTGEALAWLQHEVAPTGAVVGVDLATAHVSAARAAVPPDVQVLQADLLQMPFPPAAFDAVWCTNTLHHLRDPLLGMRSLAGLLRPGGRLALGQSSLLPDMFFAWDARLERLTNEAVRQYYRERYGVGERELAPVRALLGLMRRASLQDVSSRTFMIERITPLKEADEAYLREAIFRDTWGGERLRPYLSAADHAELMRLCDPQAAQFALRRPDFHFLQTFTVVVGRMPP
ncbi:MAG TPA: methyltransferase domain-containing protein [Steroidobacteraceae bacterium]|nr:methyltransferase domain-containing protein [Steroidobacteraceae bacterium]